MSDSVPIETAHEDMIVGASTTLILLGLFTRMRFQHDAQLDYYGKRLATCSSDRTVKVFDVIDGEPQRTSGGQTLKGCAFFWLPAFTFIRLILLLSLRHLATPALYGKLRGLIRNMAISSRRVHMMGRC